jgi:hypothetical protein
LRIVFAVLTPVLIAPLMVSMVMAMRSFQQSYSEVLCRMESVRVHALENIESDEPIEANFGGDECLTPVLPTIEFSIEELPGETPAPTPLP